MMLPCGHRETNPRSTPRFAPQFFRIPKSKTAYHLGGSVTQAFLQVQQWGGTGPSPDPDTERVRIAHFSRNLKWVRPFQERKLGDRYCLRRPASVAGSSAGQALRAPRLRMPLRAALRLCGGRRTRLLPVLPRGKA